MAAEFWQAAGLGLGAVLAGSLLFEALLTPRPPLRGRPAAAWRLHLGICLATYALEWLLFQRAYFGAVAALSTVLLLVVVSNVKTAMLREPFLFQDFEYFTDLLRHPRLYLPFFGVWNALGGALAFAVCVYLGFTLEPSLPSLGGGWAYLAGTVGLAGSGMALIAGSRLPPPSFAPVADLQALGFLAFIWAYGRAERQPPPSARRPFQTSAEPRQAPTNPPHLVVVQSESFFDARRLCPEIAPAVMAAFDAAKQAGCQHGLLDVPAWGANTVRTEFGFLSALGQDELGVHRFNPYRTLATADFPSLASYLKGLGYRTVCVHPYWPSFYRRDRAYPALGFDQFIGLDAFGKADYCGPYVGDVAVGRTVQTLLDAADGPLFVFVITMENHGPLHWESVNAEDNARLYTSPPPPVFTDLTVYLRHVENAGRMLTALRTALATGQREGWLCWYGDHVPIMPKVYAHSGFADKRSNYFLCGPQPSAPQAAQTVAVESLAAILLTAAGLGAPMV